jgi:hypothetical protein
MSETNHVIQSNVRIRIHSCRDLIGLLKTFLELKPLKEKETTMLGEQLDGSLMP